MVNDYLIQKTIKMFHRIAVTLINPDYKLPRGGEAIRTIRKALEWLEKEYGTLNCPRIVDYVVCSAYPFKDRGGEWKINQVFGKKSFERFNTDKGRVHYEDRWLATAGLSRSSLLDYIVDKSKHPKAIYIYLPSEEGTKARLLNKEIGFIICQNSTLGWSPLSEACSQCDFKEKCKTETHKKYPEIFRLRLEYGS